jgi:hypothetical protein
MRFGPSGWIAVHHTELIGICLHHATITKNAEAMLFSISVAKRDLEAYFPFA